MKFSEFVIVEKPGVFIDPLGFLKPSRALQDTLFRQFTVLSNHPAYHGALCAIWLIREAAGDHPKIPGYAHRFRELELFWGLMNAARGESVINVNKYKQLLTRRLGLRRIPSGHSIFQRLGYGTLGHYSRPSIEWGLLSTNGDALGTEGRRLAHAFSSRSRMDFIDGLSHWRAGDEFDLEDLAKFGEAFHLTSAPSSSERAVWRDLIATRMTRDPATQALWKSPLTLEELARSQDSAAAYCDHQTALAERYGTLSERLRVIHIFERLAGAVQFVFDLHLASLQFRDDADLNALSSQDDLAQSIVDLAALAVSNGVADAGRLFASLAGAPKRYTDVRDVIAQHHWVHQRSKGVSPYFNAAGLLVRDKVHRAEMGTTLEALEDAASSNTRLDLLQFRSRRDWHFLRCRTYHDWAYGVPA